MTYEPQVWKDGDLITAEKMNKLEQGVANEQVGPQGIPGKPGRDGQDGVSPTVAVTAIPDGHRVTITDADGSKSFDVMDGRDGAGGGRHGGSSHL